jgi:hypothetical protein
MGNLIRFLVFDSFYLGLPLYSTDCELSLDIIYVIYFYNPYNCQKMRCYSTVVSRQRCKRCHARSHPSIMSAANEVPKVCSVRRRPVFVVTQVRGVRVNCSETKVE